MDPKRFKINQQHQSVQAGIPDSLTVLSPSPPHHYRQPDRKNGKHYAWLWLVIIVVLAVALAGAGYLAINHSKVHKTAKKPVAAKSAPPKTVSSAPPIPSSSFTSPSFGVTFSYPQTWNVVDSGAAGVNVYSTPMTITNASDQPVLAEVDVTLLNQGALPSAFGTNTSVAVLNSQKVVFTHPGNQPADTYISFVQYPATTIVGGLDGIYVTGNYGYQKDQTIPNSQVAQVNPLIMVVFSSCANSTCSVSTQKPLTISAADWNNSSFSAPILLILSSLSFS